MLGIDSDIQRLRVHNPPPIRLLHRVQDHHYQDPARQQERRGPRRAEELDPYRRARRLPGFWATSRLVLLNRVLDLDRVFTNLLLTQQKLVRRERIGSNVIERHEPRSHSPRACPPLWRAKPAIVAGLPHHLLLREFQRQIARLCNQLERLALAKTVARKDVPNRSFDATDRSVLLGRGNESTVPEDLT